MFTAGRFHVRSQKGGEKENSPPQDSSSGALAGATDFWLELLTTFVILECFVDDA